MSRQFEIGKQHKCQCCVKICMHDHRLFGNPVKPKWYYLHFTGFAQDYVHWFKYFTDSIF